MSRCTTLLKGLYLRLGNLGHDGILEILSPSLLHIAMYWAQPLDEVILSSSLLHIVMCWAQHLDDVPYLWDQLHLSCCTCHHLGVQLVVVVVVEKLAFSLAQVVFPPPWGFEREQVVMPFFSLHFACSACHWVSLLMLLTESQQACALSSVVHCQGTV